MWTSALRPGPTHRANHFLQQEISERRWTEQAVKVDTSGKVIKQARLKGTAFEISVPLFVENGDKIEIDTRTHEYRKRV